MNISASLVNEGNKHSVVVQTGDSAQPVMIPARSTANGSSVNGGELLCLALATCFCNDLYREAGKTGMKLTKVTVEAWAEFGAAGEPGTGFHYRAHVEADAPQEAIDALIRATDGVAEIQKTLRNGAAIKLVK
jgi:organic hydroperoxide reductase OsmC/OhrA